jgi:hypothetical protein
MLADASSSTLWTCQLSPAPNTTPVQRHTALRGFDLSTGEPKIRCNVISNNLYRIPVDASGKPGQPVDIWMGQPMKGPDGMRAANGKLFVAENWQWQKFRDHGPRRQRKHHCRQGRIENTDRLDPYAQVAWTIAGSSQAKA